MPAPLWVPAKPRALTRGHYHLPWAGVSRQDSRVSHRAMALVSWAHVLRAPRLTAPSWKMALPPGGGAGCVSSNGERGCSPWQVTSGRGCVFRKLVGNSINL